MVWDKDAAAEAGKKSGEARRRKSQKSPEERARDAIGSRLGDLTNELLDAALGQGDFVELKPETRLHAIFRAMEWGMGKPPTAPKPEPPKTEKVIPTGEDLFERPA